MEFSFELNSKGHIKKRESFDLEFKQSFQFGGSLLEYLRSLAGMANNKGGQIIFGIKNSPHTPVGLQNDKFEKCDPAIINQNVQKYFSHEIEWTISLLEFDGKIFGQMTVKESDHKPIICKATYDKILREGAIYYRYRAETREIQYPELSRILTEEKEKEKKLWMNLISKIGSVGPRHVNILDTYKGEIEVDNGAKILLDKQVIDKIKFIKEGQFSETEGAPTLKLIGEITGIVDTEASILPDKAYPYTTRQLQEKFSLNQHDIKCILWNLQVKGNQKYHTYIKTGSKSNPINKYSEECSKIIEKRLEDESFIKDCRESYRKTQVADKHTSKLQASLPLQL